jgi:aspartyl protease family protein
MTPRSLLLASVLLVLVAISAPGLLEKMVHRLDDKAAIAVSRSAESDGGAEAARATGRQVEIKAGRDGHFYVDAEINFRPVRLMVDTGASVIALRKSDAEAVGIRPGPAEYAHPVSTANGTTYGAETELDSIAVRDIELAGVRAMVLPDEQLGISLLGASFLNRLERFQVSGGTLVFEN